MGLSINLISICHIISEFREAFKQGAFVDLSKQET